jgi:AcrR family transcriptional regulator
MGMSIPYEATGRTRQKLRTRSALVDAARALIDKGITPTVEEAAAAASISRTTAYRYFPNQRGLLVAAYPVVEQSSLLGEDPPSDVHERLDIVVREILRTTVENEPALRTALRLTLEPDEGHHKQLLVRGGRAIGWLRDALSPLEGKMPTREIDRLVYAIRSSVGIEALVWLCDVAGLSRKNAVDVMTWSSRALLRSALAEMS